MGWNKRICNPSNHLHSGTISGSMSRDQRDHSICTAVIGCTACARLMVSGLASDNPMYLTFPSSTNFLSSPICNGFEQRNHMSKHTSNADCWKARLQRPSPRWELWCQCGAGSRGRCSRCRAGAGWPRSRRERTPAVRTRSGCRSRHAVSRTWWPPAPAPAAAASAPAHRQRRCPPRSQFTPITL